MNTAAFPGGDDQAPAPRAVTPPTDGLLPDCDDLCRAHCDGLGLANPVNRGVCESLWGVGLDIRPVNVREACRRVWVDVLGRYPTAQESAQQCEGKPWGEVVTTLLALTVNV